MENPNWLPDLKKNDENKNRKLPKLRHDCVKNSQNKEINESIIDYCKLCKLSIKLNWLNWISSQFPNLKTKIFNFGEIVWRRQPTLHSFHGLDIGGGNCGVTLISFWLSKKLSLILIKTQNFFYKINGGMI